MSLIPYKMSFNNDDFDEDVDDILLSDNENIKKPKKNQNFIKKDKDENTEKPLENNKFLINDVQMRPVTKKNERKNNLFEDTHDPLAMIDLPKQQKRVSQDPKNKSAKSVLDSLLNPVSELDEFSFKKPVQKSKEVDKTNDKQFIVNDDFWNSSNHRPSTGEPITKNSKENSGNKRTVRFSNDTTLENDLDLIDSVQGRPVTAPSISTEGSKSRFISRFEEAEFNDVPKHSDFKYNSESDPTLWKATVSDDFRNSSESATKSKNNEDVTDGNFRTNPKQMLTDFLQASSEDVFSRSLSKTQPSLADQSSIEDLLFPTKPMTMDESYTRRRSSVQPDHMFDRPKTSKGRTEGLNLESPRRLSIQADSSFERSRTGYESSDLLDSAYLSGQSKNADLVLERPRTGHGRMDHSQSRPVSSRSDLSDIDIQLKQVQSERDDLQYKLDGIIKRNKEEMEILEKTYKNRLELMEDNIRRKESRFMDEIEMLTQQNKQKLQMLEDERMEMRSELSRRQDDIENQKRNEILRIKEQHKLELDKLRNNYEDLLEKLQFAKSEEDSTIRSAQPTTIQLQSVLAQVSTGAQDLASLKQQLLDQMNRQIKEKDIELKAKNDSLRILEEQLNVQKDENVKERERLQSLISKLDVQLKEQSKQADEERWYLRQEQNKLAALQTSLDMERDHLLSEKDKNNALHEEFRSKLLEEQKQLFEKVYEEKRSLAEERAKLTREVSKWSESSQISNVKKNQESAELEGIRAAIAEERREIENMRSQIANEREENIKKISQINSLNYDIRLKTEKLNQFELELSSRQKIIEEKEMICRQLDINAEESLKKAKAIQNSHQDQLESIQKQLTNLAEKEKQMHKEQIQLESRRATIMKQDKSGAGPNCSNVLRDSAIGGSLNNITVMSGLGIPPKAPNNRRYETYFNPDMMNSLEYSHNFADKLEEERLIHTIRRAADEDRDYLENERAYLRSLAMNQDSYLRSQVRG